MYDSFLVRKNKVKNKKRNEEKNMPEFLLDRFFGFNYDVVSVVIGVPLVLFAVFLVIHICIFAKMLHEKISDPKGLSTEVLKLPQFLQD